MKAKFATDLESIRVEQERIHRLVRRMDSWIGKLSGEISGMPLEGVVNPPPFSDEAPERGMGDAGALQGSVPEGKSEGDASRGTRDTAGGTPALPETGCLQGPADVRAVEQAKPEGGDGAASSQNFSIPAPAAGSGAATVPPEPTAPAAGKELHSTEESEPLEIQFGRVWLVRIGIVILLTGLVFLGNLAYQHIVPRLGPVGKLSLIGLAGAALCTAGWRLERRRESLRNYGRVLFAGGCATLYYTAYAAHFVKALQVISSPIAGGLLLLALAGGMVWVAHRRKSEPIALLAVLLSYYASGINPSGAFTLFSSMLLTCCATFFLVRNRWTRLSFASIAGTYVSYAWWRFLGGSAEVAQTTITAQICFLAGYWSIFTVGAFFTAREAMSAAARTAFITLNNGAFFALGTLAFALRVPQPDYWLFPVISGAVLLVLARLAAMRNAEDEAMEAAYFVQGLVLVGLGLVNRLTGHQIALAFAAQSVVLLLTGKRLRLVRGIAAALSAMLAFAAAWSQLPARTTESALTGGVVALVIAFDSWWVKRKYWASEDLHPLPLSAVGAATLLGAVSLYAGVGALAMIPWLALGAGVMCLGACVLRFRELAMCGQWLLPIAAAAWAIHEGSEWPSAAGIVATGIGLAQWWPRQRMLKISNEGALTHEAIPAVTAGAVGILWLARTLDATTALPVSTGIAVVWIGAALATRARVLAGVGLGFIVYALALFLKTAASAHWLAALAPTCGLLALAYMTRWMHRLGGIEETNATQFRKGLFGTGLALLLPWAFVHIPGEWLALFFAGVGAIGVVMGRRVEWMGWSGLAMGALAGVLMLIRFEMAPTWQHLLAILGFPALCRWTRRNLQTGPLVEAAPGTAWATAVMLTLWVLRADHVYEWRVGTTVILALLALGLFPAGLVLRERAYRLCGMGLLALGVGHLFMVDVWAFNPVSRIVSFIVLGLVLLLVGYFYNRFEERLRRWL